MALNGRKEENEWRVGDLCKRWIGIISRVVEVLPAKDTASPGSRQRFVRLRLEQATPLFGVHNRKVIVMARQCTPLSLVDLGTEYMNLGNFIRDEARRLGMEA